MPRSPGQKPLNSWAGIATLSLVTGFVVYLVVRFAPAQPAGLPTRELGGWFREAWHEHVGRSILYVVAILCLLLGEKLRPAVRARPILSTCLFADLGYAALTIAAWDLLLPVYRTYLEQLYEHSIGRLIVSPLELPWALAVAIAFLLGDLLAWFDHLLRHKVPFFWEFHAVHHSQEEMNPLTDYRVHPIDFLVVAQIRILPLALIADSLNLVFTYVFVSWLLPKFYHANIKTNLGPLRYVLVTPQSHRVHHSRDRAHVDTNFGVILSVWDRLFGTQCPDSDVYPATGIHDAGYPNERGRDMAALPGLLLRQLTHPILRVVRGPGAQPG